MSTPTNPRREHPSTYFVADRSSEEELTRVVVQDQMLTSGMGGVLPEQPDPTAFHRVLDVSCGTGGWLIEVAKTYPTIGQLVGVDVSSKLVEYAQEQTAVQKLDDRVEFLSMDALRMLEFPKGFFDLVNLRCGWSYLRTWDWAKLLHEFQRISRSGGVIRVTEGEIVQSTSPALTQLSELFLKAVFQAGHFFTPNGNGVTSELTRLFRQNGIQSVQIRAHVLELRAGTPEGQAFYEDMKHAYRTFLPFLRKWTRVPDDYEDIYQQALKEMRQPDHVATWNLLTAWGTSPSGR
jgi:SAM-dependent methyltransferase